MDWTRWDGMGYGSMEWMEWNGLRMHGRRGPLDYIQVALALLL
jgi:hypothetical protein